MEEGEASISRARDRTGIVIWTREVGEMGVQ